MFGKDFIAEIVGFCTVVAMGAGIVYSVLRSKLDDIYMKKGDCGNRYDIIDQRIKDSEGRVDRRVDSLVQVLVKLEQQLSSSIDTLSSRIEKMYQLLLEKGVR